MKWAAQTGDMGEVRNAHRILISIPEVEIHLSDLGILGR
jgi:hypothetical protein